MHDAQINRHSRKRGAADAEFARGLWRRRVALRFALGCAPLSLPFAVGAMLSGVAALPLLGVLALIAAYLAFWSMLAMVIGSRGGVRSPTPLRSPHAGWC